MSWKRPKTLQALDEDYKSYYCNNKSTIFYSIENSNMDHNCSLNFDLPLRNRLTSLPDNVLSIVFCSGYFSFVDLNKRLTFICKKIRALILENLSIIQIRGYNLSGLNQDHFYSMIASFRHIKFIDLSYCNIAITKLDRLLSSYCDIKGLCLRAENVRESSISYIGELKKLQYLDLSRFKYEENDTIGSNIQVLKSLSTLVWLNISYTSVSDEVLYTILSSNKNIEYLGIAGCRKLTNNCYQALQQTVSLKCLDISNCRRIENSFFTNVSIDSYKKPSFPQNLEILRSRYTQCMLPCQLLETLAMMPKLKYIDISRMVRRDNYFVGIPLINNPITISSTL